MFKKLFNIFSKAKDENNKTTKELKTFEANKVIVDYEETTVVTDSEVIKIPKAIVEPRRPIIDCSGTACVFPIIKRGKKRYLARYRSEKDLLGKRVTKEFICDSYEEGIAKLIEFINKLEAPTLDIKNFTLEEWLRYYLDTYKVVTVKPKTYEKYQSIFKNYIYINEKLANIKLCDLTTDHLETHYRKLMQDGKSPLTLRNNNKNLITALNYAVKRGYIDRNPAAALSPIFPVKKTNKGDNYNYLVKKEVDIFINNLTKSPIDIFLKLALLSGMRIGEVLALNWNDIDLENRKITVNKSLIRCDKATLPKIQSYDYKVVSPPSILNNPKRSTVLALGPVKNDKNRKINISSKIIDDLYLLFRNKKGDLVFNNAKGFYLSHSTVRRRLNTLIDNLSLNPITVHSLRHTFASMSFESNIDANTTAEILGDTVTTVNNFYLHITPSKIGQAISSLDSYLS